ncbi:MAG: class I SAM-dependent methyltransferase [Nanoarchaeota archaeon]|nr:class I SAM-dependent methyltransferase [Nanoarchaeota archaeon]
MNSREGLNLAVRILEDEEIITGDEANKYADRRDNRALTTRLVALDILEKIPIKKVTGRVLEVCCGAGDLANKLYRLTDNPNIRATDGSPGLIETAKVKYPHINFSVANVHNHLGRGKNDLVICKDAFHHFSDPQKSLGELLDLVSPGGYLYIFDLNRDCSPNHFQRREQVIVDPNEKRRFIRSLNASLTAVEFAELLRKPEIYEIISSAFIHYPFSFSDEALAKSQDLIAKDETSEYKLNTLSAVYVLQRRKR